jgi:prephenate dehydrogenase
MRARRVAIVGTGLIGGSVGLALRARGGWERVRGHDEDSAAARSALARGAVTEVARTPAEAVTDADVVLLAVPVDRIPALCEATRGAVAPHAVVTDVGSAKAAVVRAGEGAFGGRFVGGHPMAGSERHGIEAADEHLFAGAWWVLTPTPTTSPAAYEGASSLAQELGARPVAVDPVSHDALVARLSHVPQLTASALVEVAAAAGDRQALLGLAGPGFRDVTRIAASNPDLWIAILRANKAAVSEALRALGEELARVGEAVAQERWEELRSFLGAARRARLELFAKPGYGGKPIALSMLVPDRPGVLAEVTTAAGELGANIEDLRIVHSTEGGQGRLELIVAGPEAAELLVAALVARGYHPERGEVDL